MTTCDESWCGKMDYYQTRNAARERIDGMTTYAPSTDPMGIQYCSQACLDRATAKPATTTECEYCAAKPLVADAQTHLSWHIARGDKKRAATTPPERKLAMGWTRPFRSPWACSTDGCDMAAKYRNSDKLKNACEAACTASRLSRADDAPTATSAHATARLPTAFSPARAVTSAPRRNGMCTTSGYVGTGVGITCTFTSATCAHLVTERRCVLWFRSTRISFRAERSRPPPRYSPTSSGSACQVAGRFALCGGTRGTAMSDYSNLIGPRSFGPLTMMVEYEDGTVERIEGIISDAKVAEVRSKRVKRWWMTQAKATTETQDGDRKRHD